ncbi:hypothetical protein [Brucella tritici]
MYMWRSELRRKGLLPASVEPLFRERDEQPTFSFVNEAAR